MSDSTRIDVNFLSIDGDNPFVGPCDLSNVDGSKYATTLKLTDGIHDQRITGVKVAQANETSVDLDIATDLSVAGDFGLGPVKGDNVLRAKGGFRRIAFSGTLHSRGQRNGDIELGDWMDQTLLKPSWGCDLRGMLPHADGQGPNTVAIGWVVPFTTRLGANCKLLLWQSLLLKCYVPTKWLIRLCLGIPKGVKGPDWY